MEGTFYTTALVTLVWKGQVTVNRKNPWKKFLSLLKLLHLRYVYLVREQFGEEAEMVVDVLLKEGQATASHVIVTSSLKLIEAAENGACNRSCIIIIYS